MFLLVLINLFRRIMEQCPRTHCDLLVFFQLTVCGHRLA